MATPTVFITGATGTVGGALARQLRAINWGVHTTARNIDSPAAKALSSIGVKITKGDWNDVSALEEAIAGCQGLFINLYPTLDEPSREHKQAESITGIARSLGVKQVVHSGLFPIQDLSDPDSLYSQVRAAKSRIEESTKSTGFTHWTILRPGFFMPNFLLNRVLQFQGATETGVFTSAYRADTRLPLIDPEDIAKFAVAAFQKPDQFGGRTIELASEILTFDECLAAISNTTGLKLRGNYLSEEEIEKQLGTNIMIKSQFSSRDMAEMVDLEDVRSWGISMNTFGDFLERENEAVQATYRNVGREL